MLPESGRLGKRLERKNEKNGSQAEDLLEVEPLICRVLVMVLRVVFGDVSQTNDTIHKPVQLCRLCWL